MAMLIAMYSYDHSYVWENSWCPELYSPGLILKEKYKSGTQIKAYNDNFLKLSNIFLCCF